MNWFDSDALEAARERDGNPGVISAEVREYLESVSQPEVVWQGTSDPWDPDNRDEYLRLGRHDAVSDTEDLSNLVGVTEREMRNIMEVFGFEVEESDVEEYDRVELPPDVEVDPEYLATPIYRDARVLHHLLATCQLSVCQTTDVLTDVRRRLKPSAQPSSYTVDESDVRAAAEDFGILAGPGRRTDGPTTDREERFEVNHPQQGPDIGPGSIEYRGGTDIDVSRVDEWEVQDPNK